MIKSLRPKKKPKKKAKYETRVVCFLDILGFRDHVQKTLRQDGSDDEDAIKSIIGAFDLVRESFTDKYTRKKRFSQFSDSVVVSFPIASESEVFYTLFDILLVQLNLVNRGFLCRGGVTVGKIVHTPNHVFGPAVNEAYRLEKEIAVYPRIVVSKDAILAGIKAPARHHHPRHELESIMGIVTEDLDGQFYVDYISKACDQLDDPECDFPIYCSNLRKLIKPGLQCSDLHVRKKYEWAKDKYNSVAKESGERKVK